MPNIVSSKSSGMLVHNINDRIDSGLFSVYAHENATLQTLY